MAKAKKKKKSTPSRKKAVSRAARKPARPVEPAPETTGQPSSMLNQVAPKLTYRIAGTPILPLSRTKN